MAIYKPDKPPAPIAIDKWIGVNEAVGQTGLSLNEALRQVNYRITKDYKPKKREGHKTWIDFGNEKDVQGVWEGAIGGQNSFIVINDGKVYERDLSVDTDSTAIADLITDLAVVQIGTMTDAPTTIFFFESKLYFMNGTEYKEYDGTTFQDVVPYVPLISEASPPAGQQPNAEPINLLTGAKKIQFVGDGVATAFQLPELNIDATLLVVTIDGVTKTEVTHFTVNRTTGVVTFLSVPADESEILVQWVKVDATHANLVKKNKYAMKFGVGNDTSVFIWGHPDFKNTRRWCGTLKANYFPATNLTNIGTNDSAITDIKTNNANYQIIFKEGESHFSYAEYISATDTWDYPVKSLRSDVGNETFNGVQIVNNAPLSIENKSWWLWNSTTIKDERNANPISERLRQSLSAIDLTTAKTFDYQTEKEYWCNVDDMVYVWNYGNDTMYTFDNISGTCFLDIDGVVYYGSQGTVERMEGLDDNGVAITAQIDTGFNAFGSISYIKTSDMLYVGLLPDAYTSLTVYFKTNKRSDWKKLNKKAFYALLDWNNINFNIYTFKTNRNPQTFALPFSSNDYTTIQFRLENAELNETCVILDLLVQAETQGEV